MNWIEELDELLATVEDTVKGSEGDMITKARGLIQKQRSKSGPHVTIVIFDTPEKAEEGALLLSRIRQISQDQLSSKQVKRMNELIKATGFELHYRK